MCNLPSLTPIFSLERGRGYSLIKSLMSPDVLCFSAHASSHDLHAIQFFVTYLAININTQIQYRYCHDPRRDCVPVAIFVILHGLKPVSYTHLTLPTKRIV